MSSTAAAPRQSTLLQTAHSVLESYHTWDIDAILAPRTSDCTMQVIPTRLERPALSNSQYREFFNSAIKDHFVGFHLEVLDTIQDPAAHKVVFHARSTAQTPIGPYSNEYSLYLHMNDDDTKVQSIKEFVDTQYSQEFFGKLRAHLAGS